MLTALLILVIVLIALTVANLILTFARKQVNPGAGHVTHDQLRDEVQAGFSAQRGELQHHLTLVGQQLEGRITHASEAQARELERERRARAEANRELRELLDQSINERLAGNLKRSLDELSRTVSEALEKMRTGNEHKLEQMRLTVDEKLQGTLEKRLGESFTLVSERLEQVQKGLGEMQHLAADVGGLKRVLTNVKNRGGWGEVQLARQLEDMMTPEQYEENVAVTPGSKERVEFALTLPGKDDDRPVYLPIDSKFPQEDYERLLDAQEAGDVQAVEQAGKALERVLLEQAKLIASKYVAPPHTTDFAIMYLPTEGLFAEAMRRPGLVQRLQQEERVMVMGPTTLMAILNSLQMGFRTLAIEQRSSEVWQVLSSAKHEFQKYGDVWDKIGKQLQTVQNTVKDAGVRTRAVERKLRDVEQYETRSTHTPLEQLVPSLGEGLSQQIQSEFDDERGDD